MNNKFVGVVAILLVLVMIVIILHPVAQVSQAPSIPTNATLNIQTVVPTSALYGSEVDVKEVMANQGQPAVNPKLTLSVSLGNDTIYSSSQLIDLTSSLTQDYNVALMDPNSLVQPTADTAIIQSTLSADNGNPVLNTTTIQLWKPTATLNVALPNSCFASICNPLQPTQLNAGTYLFKDASVQYTGSQPGTFQVAVGVEVDPQTAPYFQMNKQLAQSYNDDGNPLWIVSSDSIDLAHPLWDVPLGSTEFTVSTGGIPGVIIHFDVVLYLEVGNGQYVTLNTVPETFQINNS